MKPFLRNMLLKFAEIIGKTRRYIGIQITSTYKPVFACLFAFSIVFCGIYITASRNLAIKTIKKNLSQIINHLNEFGLDIAYDNIEFNSMMFYPLVKIEGLKIYSATSLNEWALKFNTVKAYPNIIGTQRLRFQSIDGGTFKFNEYNSVMSSNETFLDIIYNNQKFEELVLHAEDINIKDFAKIEKIAFLSKYSEPSEIEAFTTPSYINMFEVNNVKINGLIDYPLSSNLKLLYAQANIMGKFEPDEIFITSIGNWLHKGGFIDVPNLIVQWEPLTLVGRGNINFNEALSPRINFNTSSKGLLTLIKDLQKRELLENSNVFVANIMLNNKAYKMNPDDEEYTIVTPIGYADGKLTIENLPIKDFNK
ncbi:MAG: DUF2125 domain-containing protein [Alphaproteobacteria bacterium]|nr:DUF2125 domain-containing protein [Alphaproteobacteria bacterium]